MTASGKQREEAAVLVGLWEEAPVDFLSRIRYIERASDGEIREGEGKATGA